MWMDLVFPGCWPCTEAHLKNSQRQRNGEAGNKWSLWASVGNSCHIISCIFSFSFTITAILPHGFQPITVLTTSGLQAKTTKKERATWLHTRLLIKWNSPSVDQTLSSKGIFWVSGAFFWLFPHPTPYIKFFWFTTSPILPLNKPLRLSKKVVAFIFKVFYLCQIGKWG